MIRAGARRGVAGTATPAASAWPLIYRTAIINDISDSNGSYRSSSYPLAITFPMGVGAAPNGLDADSRAFRTYTGLEMTLPLCAVHGRYPYVWTGSNLPSGAVVEQYTNVVGRRAWRFRWPNPTGTASNIVLTCTDSEDTEDSVTFSIEASTSSTYFRFVDSDPLVGNDSNPGTLASPWRTLAPVQNLALTAGGADWHVIFREGTYTVSDMVEASSGFELRVDMGESDSQRRPNIWYSYPGERAVIDFGQVGGSQAPRIRFSTANHVFLQNLDFRNGYVMGLQIGIANSRGAVIDGCTFDELSQFAPGGSNAAHIMWSGSSPPNSNGNCIVNCEFSNLGFEANANALKFYYQTNTLVEGCYFHDFEIAIEVKESVESFCIRANLFDDVSLYSIGGDWADNELVNGTFGDICYNFFRDATANYAFRLNQSRAGGDGPGRIDAYRNTAFAPLYLPLLETSQGPVLFAENVILGSQHIIYGSVDMNRVTETANLEGTAGDARVDATTGELSGSWAEFNFQRGHRAEE